MKTALLATCYLLLATFAANAAITGASRAKEKKWWPRAHEGFLKELQGAGSKEQGSSEAFDIVFLGDSITDLMRNEKRGNKKVFDQFWGKYKTVNIGISGDRIENVIWRLENGELDGYKAKVFRILIGTNNLPKHWTAEKIAEGIKQIVSMILDKHPESRVELLTILPRADKKCPADGMERIQKANLLTAKLCDVGRVVRFDAYPLFMDDAGQMKTGLFKDNLHPNPSGYEVLFTAETPIMEKLLK